MALSKKPYRILTLDGGGTFALIQAQALRHEDPFENVFCYKNMP